MSKIFLITRPKHDDITYYLFNWSKEIIELAKKKEIKVLDLKKEKANRKNLTSFVNKMRPSFIFFNGHGGDNCITGHDKEVLVQSDNNEDLLKNKIIYALSCRSAKELGCKSIKKGTVAYIGYDDDFVFVYDETKISKPLVDNIAKLFLEPSNRIASSLFKGHNTGVAYGKSQELFVKNIQKLLTSESSTDSVYIRYLLWDMQHQVCLGSQNAVL